MEVVDLLMASDVAKATNSSIDAELEEVLYTSAAAAMYETGTRGGFRENVEKRVMSHLNDRIEIGWDYTNLNVNLPPVDENSIVFDWRPDGSLDIRVYLKSEVQHVKGPTVYGTTLNATLMPRFQRIKYVANRVKEIVENTYIGNLSELEGELNENYECEGLEIKLSRNEGQAKIKVLDIYGSKIVALGSES